MTGHSRRRGDTEQRPRPIRIVPLHRPDIPAAPARARAQLSYRGGPLLGAVQVATVFWGKAWNGTTERALADGISGFFRFIVSSAYLDQLAEYGVPGHPIGRGSYVGTATITDAMLGTTVTDDVIRQMIEGHAAKGTLPATTPDSLYFVFLPAGVTAVSGSERSCTVFCGYHDQTPGGRCYAVIPSPDCAGCLGGLKLLDAMTSVASHELAEAVTDPVPGQGWYDDANGEIGDICAWSNKTLGDYTVQTLWSNRAGACV